MPTGSKSSGHSGLDSRTDRGYQYMDFVVADNSTETLRCHGENVTVTATVRS